MIRVTRNDPGRGLALGRGIYIYAADNPNLRQCRSGTASTTFTSSLPPLHELHFHYDISYTTYFIKLFVVATYSLYHALVRDTPAPEPSDLVILEHFTKDAGVGPVSITIYGNASPPSKRSAEAATPIGLVPISIDDAVRTRSPATNSHRANRDAGVNLINALRGGWRGPGAREPAVHTRQVLGGAVLRELVQPRLRRRPIP